MLRFIIFIFLLDQNIVFPLHGMQRAHVNNISYAAYNTHICPTGT